MICLSRRKCAVGTVKEKLRANIGLVFGFKRAIKIMFKVILYNNKYCQALVVDNLRWSETTTDQNNHRTAQQMKFI